jgi:hypothetical protein
METAMIPAVQMAITAEAAGADYPEVAASKHGNQGKAQILRPQTTDDTSIYASRSRMFPNGMEIPTLCCVGFSVAI